METLRKRLSGWLHMQATRIYDDFHTYTVTATNPGDTFSFSCYWQWTASGPRDYIDDCSCPE